MAIRIEGKLLAAQVKERVAAGVKELKEKGIEPCLAVIMVGENPASQVYVKGKVKDCAECGIKSLEIHLPAETTQNELLQKLAAAGYSTPVFISDAASVSPSAVLEPGCIILPQAYVGADVHLGVGCIVNAGAIVDHNATLGRGVHIAPGGIVKAGASVAEFAKVDSGEIIRSPWENA